jgi:hypothetical protein
MKSLTIQQEGGEPYGSTHPMDAWHVGSAAAD